MSRIVRRMAKDPDARAGSDMHPAELQSLMVERRLVIRDNRYAGGRHDSQSVTGRTYYTRYTWTVSGTGCLRERLTTIDG